MKQKIALHPPPPPPHMSPIGYVGETGETSDTGDLGHYTQPRAEPLNHESITIYMYTNTKYDACKRLRMLGELA